MPFDGAIKRKPKKVTTSELWLAYRGSEIKKMKPKEDVHCVVRIHERAKIKEGRDAKEKMGVWNFKK